MIVFLTLFLLIVESSQFVKQMHCLGLVLTDWLDEYHKWFMSGFTQGSYPVNTLFGSNPMQPSLITTLLHRTTNNGNLV